MAKWRQLRWNGSVLRRWEYMYQQRCLVKGGTWMLVTNRGIQRTHARSRWMCVPNSVSEFFLHRSHSHMHFPSTALQANSDQQRASWSSPSDGYLPLHYPYNGYGTLHEAGGCILPKRKLAVCIRRAHMRNSMAIRLHKRFQAVTSRCDKRLVCSAPGVAGFIRLDER